MREPLLEPIAWRRRGVRRPFIGTLYAGDDGIVLSGRDPVSGTEIALSIPLAEIEGVQTAPPGDESTSQNCVILELAGSEAIFLREIGASPSHIHVLARALRALICVPESLAAQGG